MPHTEREIRERAYAIWEQEGRPHGHDLEHWTRALEGLNGGAAPAADKAPRVKRAAADILTMPNAVKRGPGRPKKKAD